MSLFICLLVLVCACSIVNARSAPANTVLHAPFTPFDYSGHVNVKVIPALAKDAASQGVNFLWISGSMSQFDTLTMAERKLIAEAWVKAAAPYDMFVLIHVGTTVAQDGMELAQHAATIGADAIGAVPPYYEQSPDPANLAQFLAPVAAAAPELPFYYYHLPGVTHCTFSMMSFVPFALEAIPSFAGIKFVSSDLDDYATLLNNYPQLNNLFAPEPKLAGIALGAKGVVLAESFYAPTWLRMCHAAKVDNWVAARAEQKWKHDVMRVFAAYPSAERVVYRKLIGVDMGPPRLPQMPFPEAQYDSLIAELDSFSFFNQTVPMPCKL